jgi:hypothetical protein
MDLECREEDEGRDCSEMVAVTVVVVAMVVLVVMEVAVVGWKLVVVGGGNVVSVAAGGGGRSSLLVAILAWTLTQGLARPIEARHAILLLPPWIRTHASRSDISSSVQWPGSTGVYSTPGCCQYTYSR